MSGINSISPGVSPVIPQPTASTGTIPASGQQTGTVPASGQQTGGVHGSGQSVPPDQVQRIIDRMNQHLAGSDHSVRIGYASSVHQLTVEVVDNATGEVVGQFPSKAVIDSEAAMNQYIGMILSKEA